MSKVRQNDSRNVVRPMNNTKGHRTSVFEQPKGTRGVKFPIKILIHKGNLRLK